MVKIKLKAKKRHYICEACKFAYSSKYWAEKCQDYCNKHKSCSLAITKHSVK